LEKLKLVLGSQSPRRKELLGWLNLPFSVLVPNIEEISEFTLPSEIVEDVACQKGRAVLQQLTDSQVIVVASDTIVVRDDDILGKPADLSEARQMLSSLAGRSHYVYSAVYLGRKLDGHLQEQSFVVKSKVYFDDFSEDTLETYLSFGESLDKAGAYGIQGASLTFISRVEGSYSNVVGFPLSDFLRELKSFIGVEQDDQGSWRKLFV